MQNSEILERLLLSYECYYDINRNSEDDFCATAEFKSHNEQYFLIKAAKVADIDSNEYVFFAQTDVLDEALLDRYVDKSWSRGLENVKPEYGHRNSDVTLFVIADKIDENIIKKIEKTNLSKSYYFGIYGWSNFKLVTIESSSENVSYNRQGRNLKKLVGTIFNNNQKGVRK